MSENQLAEKLLAEARNYREKAYAPYSKYLVGAAVLDDQGRIFGGCNIENCSYGATVCAERVAILTAVAAGAKAIKALAVVVAPGDPAKPCGICRQVIAEFAAEDFKAYLGWTGDEYKEFSFSDLLPDAFRPEDLK
ncbi:MAG: cytidine deaminase [Eubacteriales bacterium]|nr:cytidine deaminase [Eubacteriales bacterium]